MAAAQPDNSSQASPAGKLAGGDVVGGIVETAAYVGGEAVAMGAVGEIASQVTVGAETAINGLGGSVLTDVLAGEWAAAGTKAGGILALVLVRRWVSHGGSIKWVATWIGRALTALAKAASKAGR